MRQEAEIASFVKHGMRPEPLCLGLLTVEDLRWKTPWNCQRMYVVGAVATVVSTDVEKVLVERIEAYPKKREKQDLRFRTTFLYIAPRFR